MNTRGSEQTLNDRQTLIQIQRQGGLAIARINDLENEFSFEGSQNSLNMKRRYAMDFQCEYYMAMYPFDLQKCSVVIALKSSDVDYMEIIPKFLEYTGKKELSQYFVKKYTIRKKKIKDMDKTQNVIIVDVILGRKL